MISIVINCDTRPENNTNQEMFNGVVSRDFLTDGIKNKIKFFEGFDKEIILLIDEHEALEPELLDEVRHLVDVLVIRKHNKKFGDMEIFAGFNDLNYLNALFMARGEYIFHFDGDCAAFTKSKDSIDNIINLLETYDYVSYPSNWSPNPVNDPSFENNYWVSTRFFACKRQTLDFSEILKCQLDYDYWRTTYPRTRLCHWTEHILQSLAKKGVYYPPFDEENWILWVWETYEKWTLRRLNLIPYEDVINFVRSKGGIIYPNNLRI